MPNLVPAVTNGGDVDAYRRRIVAVSPVSFWPLMTFKLLPATRREDVVDAHGAGAVAGKLYPEGVTTNSEDGVSDVRSLYPALEAMQDCGLILCVHGERPGSFVLDREQDYLPVLTQIVTDFPRLRVVLEHVTTAAAVAWVSGMRDRVAATITVHHLLTTLDDVIGGSLDPHAFCKPVPKCPSDRDTLVRAAISGDPRFFLGTDSAPHSIDRKERSGCAGVFSAPVALEALVQVFEDSGRLDGLEAFASEHGARFYGIPLNEGHVSLVRDPWTVPDSYGEHRPFLAGRELRWRLA